MTVPGYLKTFRQAVRDFENCEKSEISEISPPLAPPVVPSAPLISLNSLISHPAPSAESFARVFRTLERRCPDRVDQPRWRQAVADAERFLALWGERAAALNWSSEELFGLHRIPASPHPSYSRLSRYDATGLIWLLEGRAVTALTDTTAAIQTRSGHVTYRKHNKPALGPLGDSLEDFT